jgi:hypothetical protein
MRAGVTEIRSAQDLEPGGKRAGIRFTVRCELSRSMRNDRGRASPGLQREEILHCAM